MSHDLTPYLYQALDSPLGIVLEVSDFARAQQQLYTARRKANDPSLACLQLRHSPNSSTELWIVKGAQSAAASD